jgi:hypothetical protein
MAKNARARGRNRGPGERKYWPDEDRSPSTTAPTFAQLFDGADRHPVPPARQVWTLVFCGSKPLGITVHLAADKWVPLPLTDARARQFINRFLREGSDE